MNTKHTTKTPSIKADLKTNLSGRSINVAIKTMAKGMMLLTMGKWYNVSLFFEEV
jgi:hypothetical protein